MDEQRRKELLELQLADRPVTFHATARAIDAAGNRLAEAQGYTRHASEPTLAVDQAINLVYDTPDWHRIEIVVERNGNMR